MILLRPIAAILMLILLAGCEDVGTYPCTGEAVGPNDPVQDLSAPCPPPA